MRLAIYGANGFTGQLIGESLVAAGFNPILAGRNAQKFVAMSGTWAGSLERRSVDPENPAAVRDFLSGIDLLIQCAGPYASLPAVFMETLNPWPGIVLDVCGEFSHVENSLHKSREIVQQAGGLRVHSCGFESVPALWLAAELSDLVSDVSRICSFYKHRNPKFSPGTRATARIMSTERRMIFEENGLRFARRDEWISKALLPSGFPGDTAILSPLPEMAMLPRRYQLKDCGSYAVVPEEAARYLEKNSAGDTPVQPEGMRRPRAIPTVEERLRHEFTVAVCSGNPIGRCRTLRLHGRDPYGASAWFVRRLIEILRDSKSRPIGIRSPDEIFPAKSGLEEIRKMQGYRLEID